MIIETKNTFHGWACEGKSEPLKWMELELKQFDDDSVEMDVTHCGICGSDIHTLDSGWGKSDYPCVVGHEIVGICTRVGNNVNRVKVGDRIGVGAQSGSCLNCDNCKNHEENLCQGVGNGPNVYRGTGTYNGRWPNGDKSYGGYADKWRGHQHFVFKIPENMANEVAATFFCAGVTTYAPLKRYNVKPGDKVGVIGIGGLGHFGVQWAKAMGATVVALSHSKNKRADAKELGCDDFVVVSDKDAMGKHRNTLTHILCCSYATDFDWRMYFSLLKVNSHFIMVAIPEEKMSITAMDLAARQVMLVGSMIGSPSAIEEALEFAAKHNIKPWLNKYNMADAPEAVKAMRDGKARYRIVLENSQNCNL